MTTKLNLNGDYSAEVLSYYIGEQNSEPSINKVADEKYASEIL